MSEEDESNPIVEDAEVTADVETVDDSGATVTRSASIAEVVNEPREVLQQHSFDNDWELYDRLLEIDPELAGSVRAQSQMASGFRIISPAMQGDQEEMTDKDEKALKQCRNLKETLDLELIQPSIFKNMIVNGNDVNKMIYEDGVGIKGLQSLPLRELTIIDEDTQSLTHDAREVAMEAGDSDSIDLSKYIEEIQGASVQNGDYYVLDEATDDHREIEHYKILHFASEKRANWFEDEYGRPTYGVWGEPRVEPIKFALQAKHNTLTNKVAMDDSLIAREVYKIDVETLFGHIKNDEKREQKAETYAENLKEQLENMSPDEKPILPQEVTMEVKGADGVAREHSDFLQMMNDAIMHALNFHVGGTGRDAGGPMIGNRPAKDSSQTNVMHLRKIMGKKLRQMFKYHLMLKNPTWRENDSSDDLTEWELKDDVVVPIIEWDPLEQGDLERLASVAVKAYNAGLITRNEARQLIGYGPADEEMVDKMFEDQRKQQEINQEFTDDEDEGDSGSDSSGDQGEVRGNPATSNPVPTVAEARGTATESQTNAQQTPR